MCCFCFYFSQCHAYKLTSCASGVPLAEIALFKILTSSILECLEESKKIDSLAQSAWCELIDHWVALRVILLSSCVHTSWIGPSLHRRMNQRLKIAAEHTEGGRGTGWASGWAEGGDGLEMHGGSGRSVSSGVTFLAAIALGACCTFAFEVRLSDLQSVRALYSFCPSAPAMNARR